MLDVAKMAKIERNIVCILRYQDNFTPHGMGNADLIENIGIPVSAIADNNP
jgi:hypothetical protein